MELTKTDSQTVDELLDSMGLYEVPGLRSAVNSKLGQGAMVGVNFDNRKLIAVLASKSSEIRAFLSEKYSEYGDYLESVFESPEPIGIVDLGWNGTQQRLLSQFLGKQIFGLYVGTSKRAKSISSAKSFIFDSKTNKKSRDIIFSAIPIIEFLFSSPEERFINRVAGKNHFATEQSTDEASAKVELAKGVTAYLERVRSTSFDSSRLLKPELLFQPLLTLLSEPDEQTASLFRILQHQQNAGSAAKAPVLYFGESEALSTTSAWPAGQASISGQPPTGTSVRLLKRVQATIRKVRNYGILNSIRLVLRRLVK
jgi:hypothetical protein